MYCESPETLRVVKKMRHIGKHLNFIEMEVLGANIKNRI